MLSLHEPHQWNWVYSLLNGVPWNKFPINIFHMPIDFFYDGFSKFDGIWLIYSLMIIHDIANVFASIGYQLSNVLLLLKKSIMRRQPQDPKLMEKSSHVILSLIWLLIFLVLPLELTVVLPDTTSSMSCLC